MQAKNYKAELTGVFGCPVSENPTGVMLEAAFQEKKLNYRYLTVEVRPEDLKAAVAAVRAFNMKGINLTIPHKVAVCPLLDEIRPDAALIGAVNTVYVSDGKLVGANTDGKGFLASLKLDAGIDPAGKTVAILGAGGAARAVAVELALAGSRHITIVNRNAEKGAALSAHLMSLRSGQTRVSPDFSSEAVVWDTTFTVPSGCDILVQCTSIGLAPDASMPDIDYGSIRPDMTVCDVVPNPPRTRFLEEAEKRGARVLDGLGMLVYQGAIAFTLWTGTEPAIEVMKDEMRREFAQ